MIDPATAAGAGAEVRLDYVGSIENAATVIVTLHRGEKRLVFCDSRRRVEDLAAALRARDVSTFVSHSSLSADERRRSERGFAEGGDCVMVATSTLELGIDLGDLDRVVLVDPPPTVAALQRLGRTGRRPGSVRSCLLLATDHEALLRAAGLLRLWSQGWVEPVEPPPRPLHLLAHQLLALALQEGRIGRRTWRSWLDGLALVDGEADAVVEHLVESGFLAVDQGMFFMGPEGERRFGGRNFLELTSVIAADPQLTVLHGQTEVGAIHPLALALRAGGPPPIRLAGRSWQVRQVDWRRRRCQVEPSDGPGLAFWPGAPRALSFELCRAMRDVVLGRLPGVPLTRRAEPALARTVEEHAACVDPQGSVVVRDRSGGKSWTWAGGRANATLAAALREVVTDPPRVDDCWLRLRPDLEAGRLRGSPSERVPMGSPLRSAIRAARETPLPPPRVGPEVATGLRFAELLPARLVDAVLAGRLGDPAGAEAALHEASALIVRSEG